LAGGGGGGERTAGRASTGSGTAVPIKRKPHLHSFKEGKPQSIHNSLDWLFLNYKMSLGKMNSKVQIIFLLFFLFLSFILSSCASTPTQNNESISSEKIREMESSKNVNEMNERIMMSALSSRRATSREYRIGPQDLLEISVFEVEKLNKTARVSSQGNINLPLIGILKVKGLTADELEKEIRSLLADKYLQDPQVTVLIKEYRNQRISVMGAVKNPNVFDVTGPKTILEMLAMAGGLREDAGQLLFLLRPPKQEEGTSKVEKGANERKPETFVIDLEGLLVEGNLSLNLPLLHGDVVNVPVSGKVFVGGEVKAPGGFIRGKNMTLSQAIVLAGGIQFSGNGSETRIFRYSEKGTGKEILTANVYSIQKGKKEDISLKENDIVIVPKSGVKTFLVGVKDIFRAAVGIGKYSVGF
jgi:polysaccharide export outer membrane protein